MIACPFGRHPLRTGVRRPPGARRIEASDIRSPIHVAYVSFTTFRD